uniref:vacuolar protein sorting-associated protein 37C-like n=1 Tax=Halichoerus grypus TaxID=9711 RepID=UPI001658CCEB|nr:vacuolar protein sorting-associated protein 37C-like [Halichoerus grypus]
MPPADYPSLSLQKATDDLQRRLADMPSSLTEGLTPQASPKTGAGDCRAKPPPPPRPLSQVVGHRTVVQEPEPTEAEPEAAPPPEELEPAAAPSAALEGGVEPATSAGDQEPAGLPEPHPEPTALRGELPDPGSPS